MPDTTILAIETSCDETAAAVVINGRVIRSNVVSSQIDVHRATGGVVPEVAARLQLELIIPVIRQALTEAGLAWRNLDAIAVTAGPGLAGPLLVGLQTAKILAWVQQLPLLPVNHLAGHVYACLYQESRLRFPYLALVVSGGHTELLIMRAHHDFELLGSTRDDAAGEAFDKVASLLGLPYPGGPEISRLAEQGNPQAIDFPIAMAGEKTYDFSYSGLKTAVWREATAKRLTAKRRADLAASFQRAVIASLIRQTKRAAETYQPTAVLLGGGVAANRLLRRELAVALGRFQLLACPRELATDNAAMIGVAAFWLPDRQAISADHFDVEVYPSWPLSPYGGAVGQPRARD